MATKKQIKTKYDYNIPFTGDKRKKALKIITDNVKKETPPQKIYEMLKKEKLGYRKQNVLQDIRYKYAIRNTTSKETREKSTKWFINIFEKFRQENKYNSKQAKKYYIMAFKESFRTITDAKKLKILRDEYKRLFKTEMRSE